MRITVHARERAQERGIPPYILQRAAAAIQTDGCYKVYHRGTYMGALVVEDGTVRTVLSKDMSTPVNQYIKRCNV